jgi:hypothetical protein
LKLNASSVTSPNGDGQSLTKKRKTPPPSPINQHSIPQMSPPLPPKQMKQYSNNNGNSIIAQHQHQHQHHQMGYHQMNSIPSSTSSSFYQQLPQSQLQPPLPPHSNDINSSYNQFSMPPHHQFMQQQHHPNSSSFYPNFQQPPPPSQPQQPPPLPPQPQPQLIQPSTSQTLLQGQYPTPPVINMNMNMNTIQPQYPLYHSHPQIRQTYIQPTNSYQQQLMPPLSTQLPPLPPPPPPPSQLSDNSFNSNEHQINSISSMNSMNKSQQKQQPQMMTRSSALKTINITEKTGS